MSVYCIAENRSEKTVRFKTPQGKEVCLTREVYLRDDIPCKCLLCGKTGCITDGQALSGDIKTYIVVDGSEALDYWEVFEFDAINGIILTLSTANFVQQQATSRRPYKRIREALEDPVQSCIMFDNEFHEKCFRPPRFGESPLDFTTRLNWIASQWYQKHLGSAASVILLTDNKSVADECASKCATSANEAVSVLNLQEFLSVYHPNLSTANLLLESLKASLCSKTSPSDNTASKSSPDQINSQSTDLVLPKAPEPGNAYPAHLPESALQAGLRSGQFLRGILRVSRFRSTTEAMVALTDASAIKHQPELKNALASRSEIAVLGAQHRNRAMDGDVVVIRLLSRDKWTNLSSNISASESNAAEVVNSSAGTLSCKRTDESDPSESGGNLMPCGFVVGIVSRGWRDYVCSCAPSAEEQEKEGQAKQKSGWIIATPWDRRTPRIRLHTTQYSKLAQERFVVRVDSWDASSNFPNGHFVQSLGRIGDLETETQTLLIEHNLAIRAFSDAQLNELSSYAVQRPWHVDLNEVKRRRDLRSPLISGNPKSEDLLIFSIDPEGCQDVDDTLSVRWLDPIVAADGTKHRRIQLGVHIADVTYFVPPTGHVDAEARRRSTSIYLADRRYDMLPGLLSGDLCSLWSAVDRYAVSVLWEIDLDAFEVLDVWYGRTVIRSSYKLTYEIAQSLYDITGDPINATDETASPRTAEQLMEKMGGLEKLCALIPEFKSLSKTQAMSNLVQLESAVKLLVLAASEVRTRRVARGGLELDSVEVGVRFSDPQTRSGKLTDLVPKEPLEMHGTVAELMIFANHWVARRCLESYPERSCLRRHPPPRPEFFDELQRCAASRGFQINTTTNRSLAVSLAEAVDPKDPEVKRVLLQLTTRAMTNALYFSTGADTLTREQFAHYGLALNLYTHFTSPIRRYADMIVHRVLLTALGDCRSAISGLPDPTEREKPRSYDEVDLATSDQLSSICRHMNEQHWAAQQVQRASMELFQCLFFRNRPEDDPIRIADGIVCQLRGSNGFIVMVSRFGIRGAVCVQDHKGQIAWADGPDSTQPNSIRWMPAGSGFEVQRVHAKDRGDCGHLEVCRPQTGAVQRYALFDHVTVSIHVSDSITHGLGLRLQLLTGPKADGASVMAPDAEMSEETKQAKAHLIQSVHTNDVERREKRLKDEQDTDADAADGLERDSLIANLHDPTSAYHRFHKILRQTNAALSTD